MSLYTDIRDAGVSISNHESDLYFPATEHTEQILAMHSDHSKNAKRFKADDGRIWYDVPFAYDPWWIEKAAKR